MIYEYALTEEAGHVARPSTPGRLYAAGRDDKSDPNKTKYVSRRLYVETKGLGLRYNDITFRNFESLQDFAATAVHFRRVKNVTISNTSRYPRRKKFWLAFRKVSQEYPSLKIKVCVD
jgi:hypothetical protein